MKYGQSSSFALSEQTRTAMPRRPDIFALSILYGIVPAQTQAALLALGQLGVDVASGELDVVDQNALGFLEGDIDRRSFVLGQLIGWIGGTNFGEGNLVGLGRGGGQTGKLGVAQRYFVNGFRRGLARFAFLLARIDAGLNFLLFLDALLFVQGNGFVRDQFLVLLDVLAHVIKILLGLHAVIGQAF